MSQSPFHSEAGPSRRRGKYAPHACNSCRRRKCKCDGVTPVCQPCAASGYECSWTPEGELDRPVTKQLVEGLRAKIHHLETEIAQLKQEATPTATHSSSSGPQPDAEFSPVVPQSIVPSGNLWHVNTSPQVAVEYGLLHQPHIQTPPSSENRLTPLSEQTASPDDTTAFTYQYITDIDTSLPLDDQPPEHRASLDCEWNRHLPDLGAVQFSRYQHDTLLSRCFNYGAAWILGLLPHMFLRDMLKYLTPNSNHAPGVLQYYSPLLHYSFLAFASPLSDDPIIRRPSTREKFATHAKQWLDEEFTYLNPSLVISLILLSEYHLGIGERNTGYMYTGMSMRAARVGIGSPLRDWYRWSAFMQEKMLANEMHRPDDTPAPTIPITPPLALKLELDGHPPSSSSITDWFTPEEYTRIALECFTQCVKLTLISTPASGSSSTTNGIHQQLEAWFNALPDSLVMDQSDPLTSPSVLALNIRYWWSILQLYPANTVGGPSHFTHLATEKLVELFRAFQAQHGFKYFPRNLLKALHACARTLIMERLPGDGLDICLNGLRAWSCAEPMLLHLMQLSSTIGRVHVDSIQNVRE